MPGGEGAWAGQPQAWLPLACRAKGICAPMPAPRGTPRPRWVRGAQSLSLWGQARGEAPLCGGRAPRGWAPTPEHIGTGVGSEELGCRAPRRRNEKGAPGGVIFQQKAPPAL